MTSISPIKIRLYENEAKQPNLSDFQSSESYHDYDKTILKLMLHTLNHQYKKKPNNLHRKDAF